MKPHGDRLAHFANPAVLNERFRARPVSAHTTPSVRQYLIRSTRFAAGAFSAGYLASATLLGTLALPLPLAILAGSANVLSSAALSTVAVVTLATMPRLAQAQVVKTFRDETPDADTAIAGQEWDRAIAELDKRIASNPRDVQARFKRATALARLGRDDEAIRAFIQITQTYPELPEPYNNLAALYAKHGRYQEARATLETALSANPNFSLARRNLGDIYLRLAAASYQQAAKQDPADRLAIAREKGIEAIITNAPANSPALNARRAPRVAPPRHTTAEPVNKHGFVPSMGNQPPTILPETTSGTAVQN
jgi:tetratricopeptide (TPR) repeat protein